MKGGAQLVRKKKQAAKNLIPPTDPLYRRVRGKLIAKNLTRRQKDELANAAGGLRTRTIDRIISGSADVTEKILKDVERAL